MTRREFEITDMEQILKILDTAKVLHLGLSDDGQPYVVPMNYGYTYENDKLTIYLHGATEGYKYEVLAKNPKISFSHLHQNCSCHLITLNLMERMTTGINRNRDTLPCFDWICNHDYIRHFGIG